jgi:hypothetical protein
MTNELSSEQIKELLAKPQKRASRKKRGTDYSDRSYNNWFKLKHSFQECQVPTHDPELNKSRIREGRIFPGRFCATISDKFVCRYCFIERKDEAAWGAGYWL